MKRTKILFSLYILCCALISCDGRGNNLKEPTQMEFEQLKAEAIELATYLTDNYTVGDSIFFKTETSFPIIKNKKSTELIDIIVD